MKQYVIKYEMMNGELYYLQRYHNEVAEVTKNPIYAMKFQESTSDVLRELTSTCIRTELGLTIHPSEVVEIESVLYTVTRALGSYHAL